MPFCTKCGNQVAPADTFCAGCGARQGSPTAAPSTSGDPLSNISPRTANMLCYIPFVGWIASIIVLASPRYNRDKTARFHAFQGIYLFVTWMLVDWVIGPLFRWGPGPGRHVGWALSSALHLTVVGAWIWMLVKTAQEQVYALPILGELAQRSVAEQR